MTTGGPLRSCTAPKISTFTITSLLVAAASASAALPPPPEAPDDPYLPPLLAPAPAAGGVAGIDPGGQFGIVQVNVGRDGRNVTGDAANEPSLAVDPTAPNRMTIGWRQFDTITSNFRQAGWAYSHDGGRTWTSPGVIEPGLFRSDPVLVADRFGTFYYYSLQSGFCCDVFVSEDHGVSWQRAMEAFGGDKAWMSIDNTGGAGDGNLYVVWSQFAECENLNRTFIRSTDGGQSFSEPVALPTPPIFGVNTVGPDGTLYISGVNPQDFGTFRVVTSSDVDDSPGTPTFTPSPDIDLGGGMVFSAGPNPSGLLGQANVAVDPTNGNVYLLCSVNPPGPDPLDVHFARSTDGGATWSNPVKVNDDALGGGAANAWQWFGTMSVAPNGRIDAVWLDTRADASDQQSQLYYSFSDDGGASWAPNVLASGRFDHSLGYPQQNKLGDYFQMISDDVGAHLAWAATFNGEQDVYYVRLGGYDCNGNGVDDETDIEALVSADCNGNAIPDECEIAAGTAVDLDDDGVIDACVGDPDINGDGAVDVDDLVALILAWGPCPAPPAACPADIDGDGEVAVDDLVAVLLAWTG